MVLEPFKARRGFDFNMSKGINCFDPTQDFDVVNLRTVRALAGVHVSRTEADLIAEVPSPIPGQLGYVNFAADGSTPFKRLLAWDQTLNGGVGGWVPTLDTKIFLRASHTDDLPQLLGPHSVDLSEGDITVCTEADHESVDVWNGHGWDMVYDYQNVHRRILSTVPYPQHGGDAVPLGFLEEHSFTHMVTRFADLPDPADPILDQRPKNGETFLIRYDDSGNEYNRLVTFDGAISGFSSIASVEVHFDPITEAEDRHTIREALRPIGAGSMGLGSLAWDPPGHITGGARALVALSANSDGSITGTITTPGMGFTVGESQTIPVDIAAWMTLKRPPVVIITSVGGATPHGGYRFDDHTIFSKALRADTDQPTDQYENDLQVTRELEHEELKVWTGTTWQTLFSVDDIKGWIAQLNLFEGTAQEVGGTLPSALAMDALPDLTARGAAARRLADLAAHYYTWVGTPGYVIQAADPNGLGADMPGEILQVGDWIQIVNRGTPAAPDMHWVHIGGDLLAKSRGDHLYSLVDWIDGNYEQGALVNHKGSLWRANTGVVTGNPQPGDAGAPWSRVSLRAGTRVFYALNDASLPPRPPAGEPPFVDGDLCITEDLLKVYKRDTTRNVWESLGNLLRVRYPTTGLPAVGEALTWRNPGATLASGFWEPEYPPARVREWAPLFTYSESEVVLHEGTLWRAGMDMAAGDEPRYGHGHWHALTQIPIWEPGRTWVEGSIALVPWSPTYLRTGNNAQISHATEYTLWRATSHNVGDLPVVPGEADSQSNVPPGQFKARNWNPINTSAANSRDFGGPVGGNVNPMAWTPITRPTTLLSSRVEEDITSFSRAVVPGSVIVGLAADPKCAGLVYEYQPHSSTIAVSGPMGAGAASLDLYEHFGWHLVGRLPGGSGGALAPWAAATTYATGSAVTYQGGLYTASTAVPADVHPGMDFSGGVVTSTGQAGFFLEAGSLMLQRSSQHVSAQVIENMRDSVIAGGTPPAAPIVFRNGVTVVYGTANGVSDDLAEWRRTLNVGQWVAVNVEGAPFTPRDGVFSDHTFATDHCVMMLVDKTGATGYHGFQFFDRDAATVTAGALTHNTNPGGLTSDPWTAVGIKELSKLVDVDLTTTAPVAGDILKYDGTKWVPGTVESPTTPINVPIPGTANTAEIDLGRGNWRQASVHLTGEARSGSSFLCLAMQHSDRNWTVNRDQLIDVYVTAQYGTTNYAHRDKAAAHSGDWFYLTWAKNDNDYHVGGPYFDLQITLNRLYDNWLTMHHSITYFTSTSAVTRIEGLWTFNSSAQNQDIRFLELKSSGNNMRLGFVGSRTVV